ncbi:1,4-alpha-glucan branching protein GlgB [Clostridium rectalis]|uniref:1,4-alpha-glucan branching protein GlgB n=1 Tax=Clostridium rectalis TaxID=2040295 RepID=UPI000F63403B|nr:1,4-alpha-glucan branching protein GlgB [Clostridium rectalis]
MNFKKASILSDAQLFHRGENFRAYEMFGSKIVSKKGKVGVKFRLWAPNAKKVRIIGSFNNWNGCNHNMIRERNTGLWSIFIPEAKEKDAYKYEIVTKKNKILHKSDPYAFYSEIRPNTASIIADIDSYRWNDEKWMSNRRDKDIYSSPINIYELHLGSWKRDEENNFYNYKEIADELSQYVKDMGYTHVEILPVTEHPLDASWGYQVTGYYSLTSRYGSINDFKYFVDKLHEANIGVILDWVPGHFCKDAHGLYRFDGTPVYEYKKPYMAENYEWGTANFDLSKPQVHSFLISNALFWFEIYHIDGIRADAVSNMLYLDYGKVDKEKYKNQYGGNENLEAIAFIKKLNEIIFKEVKNPLMIAEESTAWPLVTKPTYIGGLGFNYKWNMGWMNDTLKYMEMDPIYRKWHHDLLTFPLMYAFSENFILPISHDEVVHGKRSLLDKMFGSYQNKFAAARAFFGYMISHPGKKLIFMGCEFGQFIEWKYDTQLDWQLLLYTSHRGFKSYIKDLNHFYIENSALWEQDLTSEGFQWIDHQNYNQSIISYIRKGKEKNNFLIVVCNFTPEFYENYKVGVPRLTMYEEIFNSDKGTYGGEDKINGGVIHPIREKWNTQPYYINIKIPPLSTIFIKPIFKDRRNLYD